MHYSFFAQTDPGRTRENNEDAAAFDDTTQVAVLADGMGGYNAGEVASGMATAFIKSELSRWLSEAGEWVTTAQVRRAIELCIDNTNHAIFNAANTNPQYSGMGTTLVMGVFRDGNLILGHVGDSRCYRLRGNEFSQITRDHSLLQEQIDAGLLTPAQAAVSPNRNLVTRAMGVEADVMPEIHEHLVQPQDIYLMCSDGLSDMMSDEEIAGTLRQGASLAVMADELVRCANENGGRDNITVLLVQASTDSEKRGLMSRLLGK